MRTPNRRDVRSVSIRALALGLATFGPLFPGMPRSVVGQAQPRLESIARPDEPSVYGRIVGDPVAGFRFEPTGGGPLVPLEDAGPVTFDGPGADATQGYPPMRVRLGLDQQISGRLKEVEDRAIRLEDGPGGLPVIVARGGAAELAQRPGELLVLQEGFESLDPGRWTEVGEPSIVDEPRVAGLKSLRLAAGGSAVTHRLIDPVGSGRLELAFHDSGRVVAGQQWFVDLLFRGANGDVTVRAVIDCAEESLGVLSRNGPALAVQRLARKPGWHRLGVRFGPEVELAVDGNELAHGRGPGGPLIEIRLANQTSGQGEIPNDLAVHFDDLRLVRLAEPVGGLEVAPKLDDVRLIDGDQLFGQLKAADANTLTLLVDGREIGLSWTEVSSVRFRRSPEQSRPIQGLLARVEWRSGPGNDPRDLDRAEGALIAIRDDSITLATPYAGDLTIPRDRLQSLRALNRATRIVIDPSSHHLGDNITLDPALDPPLSEGGVLERSFTLEKIPGGSAAFVLDVVDVVSEANSPEFAKELRNGELRTNLKLNGQPVDFLNRHIMTRNETPERIRLAIPEGLIRPGENILRIEQVGKADSPQVLDDIGIQTIAVEFSAESAKP
ncbi:hypothetical protein P12x_000670 [Tundrisphaera lichenicola]|uniref:hypothetical protein n=1 Tax=Tundrisphaera lichenicola TaxID=2029860 RepID=UPI003EB96F9A